MPMDSYDVGYLIKRTKLSSTNSECDAPFHDLVWILIFISIIITSYALFKIIKLRFELI